MMMQFKLVLFTFQSCGVIIFHVSECLASLYCCIQEALDSSSHHVNLLDVRCILRDISKTTLVLWNILSS